MKTKPEENKSIYELKLHEYTRINHSDYVTRVPGGWIYEIDKDMVFVPFNFEFDEENDNGI